MVLKHNKMLSKFLIGKIKDFAQLFSSLSKKYKVSIYINGVNCTCYSRTMEFHIEKNCPVIRQCKTGMLPTVQMSSGFNMKISINLVSSTNSFDD